MPTRSEVLAQYGQAECWFDEVEPVDTAALPGGHWSVRVLCLHDDRPHDFEPWEAEEMLAKLRAIGELEDADHLLVASTAARQKSPPPRF